MTLQILSGHDYPAETVALFSEYTAMLVENEPAFAQYLELQHYNDEVANLSAKYGAPDGCLLIAFADGKPAGCAAFRKLHRDSCEMKRLYVRPEFRGQGIGKALTERLIAQAKKAGYSAMLLDTLPFLENAIAMYRSLGFIEVPAYNDSPVENTVYMRLNLESPWPKRRNGIPCKRNLRIALLVAIIPAVPALLLQLFCISSGLIPDNSVLNIILGILALPFIFGGIFLRALLIPWIYGALLFVFTAIHFVQDIRKQRLNKKELIIFIVLFLLYSFETIWLEDIFWGAMGI